jgi:DNA-binding transcriptional LysR family regulator
VVSAPFVAASLVPPALAVLRARHPRLSYRLLVTDRMARLAEEPVDVAVRVGPLADSALVARRLRVARIVTVASPAYLARAGTPRRPADLDGHDAIAAVAPSGKPYVWQFKSGAREPKPTAVVDHAPSVVDAALAGLGVTQAFDYMVDALVRQGRLTALFADEVVDGPPIHAVCAPGRRATPRVRAAFEAFATAFGG